MKPAAASSLPLSALLSQTLVAFTIEFDNEYEHEIPHRTARYGGDTDAPWLISLAMWANFLQFVPEAGITARDYYRRAGLTVDATRRWLRVFKRWGYLIIEPAPADSRPNPPRAEWIVQFAPAARIAQSAWRPILASVEQRWRSRLGERAIANLGESLAILVDAIEFDLPDFLPVLEYGLTTRYYRPKRRLPNTYDPRATRLLPLSALLSRVLLAIALEYDREADVSLSITANVLRLVPPAGVRMCDLPGHSGVSKESVGTASRFLESHGLVTTPADPSSPRTKLIALTAAGRRAHDGYQRGLEAIETRWRAAYGAAKVDNLRAVLEAVVVDDSPHSPLFAGLEPHPDNWRAKTGEPVALPHFPMVLHRGGFPDGA